jgi:glutamyl/glutaminyl-tRNA synthetase
MGFRSFARTRLAPTPSGYLHLGNAASFVMTTKLARSVGAKILLRIDDLDRDRVRPEYIEDIFQTLRWLDIPWDEGPQDAVDFDTSWSQRHRRELYGDALSQLREKGHLFACTCSRSQLALNESMGYPGTCRHSNIPLDTPGAAWRLYTPDNVQVNLNDFHEGERLLTIPDAVRFAVIRKKDGEAAYQLSSVVDDLHFGVDLIVRGQDLLDSTIIQLYLASLLNAPAFLNATFLHHPLMTVADGTKLSKSADAYSIQAMRAAGKAPRDVYQAIEGLMLDA